MGTFLAFMGIVFSFVSFWFGLVGFKIETAVAVPDAPEGLEAVANLQAMHIQAVDLQIAIGAAIIATLFFVGAAVVSTIRAPESGTPSLAD